MADDLEDTSEDDIRYFGELEKSFQQIARVLPQIELVDTALSNRDYRAAFGFVEQIKEIDPNNLALNFYMARLFYHSGDYKMAREYMELTNIGPGFDDELLTLKRHIGWTLSFGDRQSQAIERELPLMPLVSMPKSASSSFSYLLSDLLDIPVGRCSYPGSMTGHVIPIWTNLLAQGGASTHEHFSASPENVSALKAAGIEKIAVQLRDPRQSFHSMMHHQRKSMNEMRDSGIASEQELNLIDEDFEIYSAQHQDYYNELIAWTESWVRVEKQGTLKVHFVEYKDFVQNKEKALMEICTFFNVPGDLAAIQNIVLSRDGNNKWPNFRSGKAEEWQRSYSKSFQDTLNMKLPTYLSDRFAWSL